jgi:hypothetical protein
MDVTPDAFAYRCLPLNIANAYGWELLMPATVSATWDGGAGLEAIQVTPTGSRGAISHFGSGVLTFPVLILLRTEPGHDLFVTGPTNSPKHGISPLTGIVETDWSPFTFTMNWKFTAPATPVTFEQGEPFCLFFPIQRGEVEAVEPVIGDLNDEPELGARYRAWVAARNTFNTDLHVAGSDAAQAKWQKDYYRGLEAPSTTAPHRSKLRLCPFKP